MRVAFLVVFTLLSSGVVATLHMCQDQVRGLEWFSGESKKCPCNKKDMNDGCCDTLVIHYDQDDATPAAAPAIPSDTPIGIIDSPKGIDIDLNTFRRSSLVLQAIEPVPIVPIWLSNQSLRIPDAC
jgi:hypothetical protein